VGAIVSEKKIKGEKKSGMIYSLTLWKINLRKGSKKKSKKGKEEKNWNKIQKLNAHRRGKKSEKRRRMNSNWEHIVRGEGYLNLIWKKTSKTFFEKRGGRVRDGFIKKIKRGIFSRGGKREMKYDFKGKENIT